MRLVVCLGCLVLIVFMLFLCRVRVSANGSGVWHSGFDLEAGTVNLAQN
jgi:hypothetical protein